MTKTSATLNVMFAGAALRHEPIAFECEGAFHWLKVLNEYALNESNEFK